MTTLRDLAKGKDPEILLKCYESRIREQEDVIARMRDTIEQLRHENGMLHGHLDRVKNELDNVLDAEEERRHF